MEVSVALADILNPTLVNQMTEIGKKYNPKERVLDVKSIGLGDHAVKRAKERFGLEKKEALELFRKLLKTATFIGETVSEDGDRSLCYGIHYGEPIVIVLSPDYLTIKTVWKQKAHTCSDIMHKKISDMYRLELRKAQRKERALVKRKSLLDVDAYARMYAAKQVLMKTTSKKKIEMQEKIVVECEQDILTRNNELLELQSSIRSLTYHVVGLMRP
jgi:hypothetical protein